MVDCGRCLATDERFSAMDVPLVVVLGPRAWPSLLFMLPARPIPSPVFALVVREGIEGTPGLGDCGNLVLPVRFRPLTCGSASDGVFGGVPPPVRAARESARASSTFISVSLDVFGACPRPTLLTLAPRGGIILFGRESLLAGGGMVCLSSSIALRRTLSGSTSALCLDVSEPLRREFSFEPSSSFVSSAIGIPEVVSLDAFLENCGRRLRLFALRAGSPSLLQFEFAIEKWARLFMGPWDWH